MPQSEIAQLPVRILHILGSIQRGGTESVVYNYYRSIDKDKIQFDIALHETSPFEIPKDLIDMGVSVYKIPSYTKIFSYISSIRRLCTKNGYKIVHSHMNAMSVFPLFAAFLAGTPVRIAHNHSTAGVGRDFIRDILKYMLRPFAKLFSTNYFACSEHAARWLFGKRTTERGKVNIIRNAIDTKRFAFNPEVRQKERERLGILDKFTIGHIGRFSPPKNHYMLISIFAEICKRRGDAVLLLIGGIGSAGGGIERGVRAKVKELGLEDRVYFLGTAEDVSAYYQAMDVFILPSLYEGLGIVAIEAQCSGLSCFLSDKVPNEVKMNKNVKFISLKTSIEEWAAEICSVRPGRSDCSGVVAGKGYEISNEASNLERLYISLIKTK